METKTPEEEAAEIPEPVPTEEELKDLEDDLNDEEDDK